MVLWRSNGTTPGVGVVVHPTVTLLAGDVGDDSQGNAGLSIDSIFYVRGIYHLWFVPHCVLTMVSALPTYRLLLHAGPAPH